MTIFGTEMIKIEAFSIRIFQKKPFLDIFVTKIIIFAENVKIIIGSSIKESSSTNLGV